MSKESITESRLGPVTTWNHIRKGLITGQIIDDDETSEWVDIRLCGEHHLRFASDFNRGRIDDDGDVITSRRSLLREVGN